MSQRTKMKFIPHRFASACIALAGGISALTFAPARADQVTDTNFTTPFYQLCDVAVAKVTNDQSTGPFFVDSYGVRALCVAYDLTHNEKYLDACKHWSERMVQCQEGMTPAGAYYMHYNRKPGETNGDWYAADSSSIGMAVLATAVRCPDGPEKERFINSAKNFADLVINNYVKPSGGVSDGLWSKSDKEWWCSSGIYGSFLFNLYAVTHDDRYLQTALHVVDWLNPWDLTKDQPFPLSQQGPAMIMYVMECYSAGWPYISKDADRAKAARTKVDWCLNWIGEQEAKPVTNRTWPVDKGWGMKVGGLPFHQYIFSNYLPDGAKLTAAGDHELQSLAPVEFKPEPQFSQLPMFMLMSYAERIDPGAIYRSGR